VQEDCLILLSFLYLFEKWHYSTGKCDCFQFL